MNLNNVPLTRKKKLSGAANKKQKMAKDEEVSKSTQDITAFFPKGNPFEIILVMFFKKKIVLNVQSQTKKQTNQVYVMKKYPTVFLPKNFLTNR